MLQTHVAVANLSLFEMKFDTPLYSCYQFKNPFNKTLKLSGNDCEDYLQRQLTSDISALNHAEGHLSARLDRSGRVHSFFYLLRSSDCFYILANDEVFDDVRVELEKFLFAEDVVIEDSRSFFLYVGPGCPEEGNYKVEYCDLEAVFTQNKYNYEKINSKTQESLTYLNGWPVLGETQDLNVLINNTRLNELAISYSKGCFLGQETAAKIETRRGAAKYPCVLKSESEINEFYNLDLNNGKDFIFEGNNYLYLNLPRELRVEGKKFKNVIVKNLPALDDIGKKERAEKLFYSAVDLYHENKGKEAISLLEKAIVIDSGYADAYETMGVIYGHLGEFESAISVMNQLLEVDEDSVMAHTNKSLYLMKLGKIEEAEEEKSLATVASFKKLGSEAKEKKLLEEEQEKKKAELERKRDMFLQVIEIDENDELANYGLSDYYYQNQSLEKALTYVNKVLENNQKYSVGYLLKGKILEEMEDQRSAIAVYEKGIEVAGKNGDMMPANEMQQRLNKIKI